MLRERSGFDLTNWNRGEGFRFAVEIDGVEDDHRIIPSTDEFLYNLTGSRVMVLIKVRSLGRVESETTRPDSAESSLTRWETIRVRDPNRTFGRNRHD